MIPLSVNMIIITRRAFLTFMLPSITISIGIGTRGIHVKIVRPVDIIP